MNSLLFADDVVRVASTADGLQGALNQLALACNASGMKINTSKTEVMALSREPKQLHPHVNGNQLNQVRNFKYLGIEFSEDVKQDREIDQH